MRKPITHVVGRLGRDPQSGYTKGENPILIASFSVAQNWVDGNKNPRTEWVKVVVKRNLAQLAIDNLKKGDLVYAEGPVTSEAYIDKNGEPKSQLVVYAYNLRFFSNNNEVNIESAGEYGNGEFGEYGEEVPF